jgi:integrase/recombinase XerD
MNPIKMKAIWCFYILKTVEGSKDKFEIQKDRRYVKEPKLESKTNCRTANIDKKLTLTIARHTFGNLSGDKISIQML